MTQHKLDALRGPAGMQKLVAATPALAERREFQRIMNLKGLDVIATRCRISTAPSPSDGATDWIACRSALQMHAQGISLPGGCGAPMCRQSGWPHSVWSISVWNLSASTAERH